MALKYFGSRIPECGAVGEACAISSFGRSLWLRPTAGRAVTVYSGSKLLAIRALHHIHVGPTDASDLGLKNGDRITVTTKDHPLRLSLRDVLVCVSPDYRLELHLDPDEADAVGLRSGDHVVALSCRTAPGHSS